ncbi:MAG: hypothetical protein V1821_02855 [bacterium]
MQCLFLVALMVAATPDNTYPVLDGATLTLESEEGDYIGRGKKLTWTAPTAHIRIIQNPILAYVAMVRVEFQDQYFRLEFAAPDNQPLKAGKYPNARAYPWQTFDRPGISISSTGRACEQQGKFTVHQVEYDALGDPTVLEISFIATCDGPREKLLVGKISLARDPKAPKRLRPPNALPLKNPTYQVKEGAKFAVEREPENYVELGRKIVLASPQARFRLHQRIPYDIMIDVEGEDERWILEFMGSNRGPLQVGTYELTGRDEPTAVLQIVSGSLSCGVENSVMSVKKVAYDDTGNVTTLEASFAQNCRAGASRKLMGEIAFTRADPPRIPERTPASQVPTVIPF